MARRQRQQHHVGTGCDRPFGSLEVGHEDRHAKTGQRPAKRDELFGIGELRQQARWNERAHFDLALAGGVCVADPLLLPRRGHDARDALQAVTQAHFTNDDRSWTGHSLAQR